jgi:putative transcriptional regulator
MGKIETNLKHFRESKGLTQKELADIVEVRRETIVHLERNKYNPSLELALKISKIFKVPVESLFKLTEEN